MSSGAERQRRCARRRAAGLAVLQVEVDLVDLAACLIDAGLIEAHEEDDRQAIAAALSKVVQGLLVLTRDGVRLADWLE
jgi:hypothetical protein